MSVKDTIAQKLATIAANSPRVYAAGKSEGIEEGKQAEYDAFWDAFQNYGEKRYYYYAFAYAGAVDGGGGWNTAAYNPKYPIIADASVGGIYSTQSIFNYSSDIEDAKVPITLKNGAATQCFYRCTALKSIPSLTLENISGFQRAFDRCTSLETLIVHGKIEVDGFDVKESAKLSAESITSIVNCLSADTTGLTVTLSLDAVKKAFETSEGANDGNTSAEWTALVATKTNWTISLV